MTAPRFAYDSMGCHWEITLPADTSDLAAIEQEVIAASRAFDATYSRFINDSLIMQLRDQTGTFAVPADLVTMLRLYMGLYDASGRKLNPLVGHTISDLGYDATYSLTPQSTIRHTPDLLESLVIEDDTHITLHRPVLIDLGALGKGFFVDRIASLLEARGITTYLIDGSGDIRAAGSDPRIIGMEDPRDTNKVIGTFSLTTGAFCASGINRRTWRDLHHVIDPHLSAPTDGVLATWAASPTAALADGLASCLFFVDPETLRTQFPLEYCVLYTDGHAVISPHFPGQLFV